MPRLFMLLIGCKPAKRHVEQHDVFFAIADSIAETIPQLKAFWPEAISTLHLDAWREVTRVGNYRINVVASPGPTNSVQLFFINLGGYKPMNLKNSIIKPSYLVLTKGKR